MQDVSPILPIHVSTIPTHRSHFRGHLRHLRHLLTFPSRFCKRRVADMIKGKTPEQIRAEFDIENDFTPEQLEEVRRDNVWCAEER